MLLLHLQLLLLLFCKLCGVLPFGEVFRIQKIISARARLTLMFRISSLPLNSLSTLTPFLKNLLHRGHLRVDRNRSTILVPRHKSDVAECVDDRLQLVRRGISRDHNQHRHGLKTNRLPAPVTHPARLFQRHPQ